ncbi:MAG: SprT family zinc-dependent metalloprotease [Candidatus Paceibacterota bacterium]
MSYQCTLSNGDVATIKRRDSSRAKRLRLTLAGGEITLTVPAGTTERAVEAFLQEKSDWIQDKWRQLLRTREQYPDIATDTKAHYDEHKDLACQQARQKVDYWNVDLQLSFNEVRVRRMKTRWGSCTGKKNLHFNYKILFLPDELQDYLVVHELCHLMHPNHSADFWTAVEDILPDYQIHHRTLRELT